MRAQAYMLSRSAFVRIPRAAGAYTGDVAMVTVLGLPQILLEAESKIGGGKETSVGSCCLKAGERDIEMTSVKSGATRQCKRIERECMLSVKRESRKIDCWQK
jgi:hypothetical protein